MSTDKQTIIDAAGAELDRKLEAAKVAYDIAVEPHRVAHARALDALWDEYALAVEPARLVCESVSAAAWDEYERAIGIKE